MTFSPHWYQRGLLFVLVATFGISYAVTTVADFGFSNVLLHTTVAVVLYHLLYFVLRFSQSAPAPSALVVLSAVFPTAEYVSLMTKWIHIFFIGVGIWLLVSFASLQRGDVFGTVMGIVGFVGIYFYVAHNIAMAEKDWASWESILYTKRQYHFALQILALLVSLAFVFDVGDILVAVFIFPVFCTIAFVTAEGLFLPLTVKRIVSQLK